MNAGGGDGGGAGLARRLAAALDWGAVRPALQLAVSVPGRRWSVAAGVDAWGEPATPATRHNVYCTAKPLLWAVLVRALDDAGLGPDTGVRTVVPRAEWDWVPDVAFDALLRHEAGLAAPDALAWRLAEPDERPGLLRQPWRGPAAEYSEVVAGLVAERAVAVLQGWDDVADAFHRLVLPAWGLGNTRLAVAPGEEGGARAGLSVAVQVTGGRRVPFLSEVLAPSLAEVSPATGCLTSADELCRFYERALAALAGEDVAYLPGRAAAERAWPAPAPAREDAGLRRTVSFGGGMMRDLADRFGSGRLSGRTFGHTGGYCTSVALADPARGLALALVVGVFVPDQRRYDEVQRAGVGAALDFLEAGDDA